MIPEISDGVMAIASLAILFVLALNWRWNWHKANEFRRPRDWILFFWMFPQIWISIFYLILAFNVSTLSADAHLRLTLFRFGQLFHWVFLAAYLLNGRLVNLINRLLAHFRR